MHSLLMDPWRGSDEMAAAAESVLEQGLINGDKNIIKSWNYFLGAEFNGGR